MQNQINKYYNTLFNLCVKHDNLELISNELNFVKHLIRKESTFRLLYDSKKLTDENKCLIIKNTLNEFHDIVREFLCIIIINKKTKSLLEIINKFLNLADKELGKSKIEIYTADEVPTKDLEKLFQSLNLEIKTKIDKSLIGGIKIKHENKIFDNSIQYQLNQLKKTLHNL